DPEVLEQLSHEARVLDLLDGPGHPEQGLVVLAEVRGHALDVRKIAVPDRLEAGTVTCRDQIRVVGELHQGVAPVEEDGVERGSPRHRSRCRLQGRGLCPRSVWTERSTRRNSPPRGQGSGVRRKLLWASLVL